MAHLENSLLSITLSLFLLMDAVGNIPIYLSLLKEIPPKRQRIIIIRELLIALAIIMLFAVIGERLLNILKIDHRTILISGGIILFLIAIRMIFPKANEALITSPTLGEPFIVPLAIPLVAGPSILAAVIIYSHQETIGTLFTAISLAWLLSTMILLSAPFLKNILGVRGIAACERLMGLLLTLMAVQMLLEGLSPMLQCPPQQDQKTTQGPVT